MSDSEPKGYKVVGNYVYAPLESAKTFNTEEEAREENKRWTRSAEKKGMRWRGRVVAVKDE